MQPTVGPALLFAIANIYLQFFLDSAKGEKICLVGCKCETKQKVKCSGGRWNELSSKDNLVFATIPQLQHLDLSKNQISRLEPVFLSIPTLRKLNLSDNKIRIIASGAFSNLTSLVYLDLSSNNLHNISSNVFSPLQALEKLKLGSNMISTLPDFVFSDLKHLITLDLSENPWNCDCSIMGLTNWVRSTNVKVQPPAKCATPEIHAGTILKRLDLPCLDVAGLELSPSHDQVVFAGDSLDLRCRGVGTTDRVQWIWGDMDPVVQFSEVDVVDRTLPEHGLVESRVRIKKLAQEHNGNWICHQISGGNHSVALSVLVLSDATLYCPSTVTHNNKGVYFWPRTVVGHNVELPCSGERVGADQGLATYSCHAEGHWDSLNTSACAYISETTRILEQFARDNLTVASDSIVDKAKRLLNLTGAIETLTDPMDLVFVALAVEKYCEHLTSSGELVPVLVDVVAGLLRVPQRLLSKAETQGKACSRLRRCLERVAWETPNLQAHRVVLAIEEITVAPDSFTGLACVWRGARGFHCSASGRALLDPPDLTSLTGRDVAAVVELPASLFTGLEPVIRQLVVTTFVNGRLFPDVTDIENSHVSSVVGVNIAGLADLNLTEPVALMAQMQPGVPAEPVWWDSQLHDGIGGWTPDGCQALHTTRDLLLFHCHRLGYYALRQGLNPSQRFGRTLVGYAAMYSGSCVLLVCLAVAMATYIMCQGAVQMSRRAKHAVANTWLSMFLLCFLFSFGAFATEDVKMCEGVGLALHYFSLSTLLWMAVAMNHMYKRLIRGTSDRPTDELPPGAPLHKPIMGLYLVGWGVGLIVCGISGAVHLRDYAQPSFCFLGAGPALSAVLVPTAILVTVLCILFSLALCAIRNNDVNGQLSEGTQGTEHVDLELLEEGACVDRMDRRSARSDVTDSEEVEDPEHAPIIQLKAHAIVLILFLLLWTVAALSTTASVHAIIPYQEPIANSMYCLVAFCLGAFVLYFYCVARSDVRARWSAWCRLLGAHRRCCRTRSVSDNHASLPLQNPPPTLLTNRPPSVNSGLTGRSSSSHRTKAVLELNNCDSGDGVVMHCKPSNTVNLVAMHRQIYRSNNSMPTYHEIASQSCADAFYNPRQSIVAKKFFKKQRRNRRNELGMRRRGDGGGTSEGEASQARRTWRPSAESAVFLSSDMENNSEKLAPSLFGYGSKINNTNIHVGHNSRKKDTHSPKNPNMMSEEEGEEDDKGGEKLLLARLVIGAEEEIDTLPRLSPGLDRVDEESGGPIPDCRSVELQCSLGDSDAQEGDDSFGHKIDNLCLASDESCAERLTSPPHYVTVLDPKYGVVKVTMSDYHQQSHRLSLASTPEDYPEAPCIVHSSQGEENREQPSSLASTSGGVDPLCEPFDNQEPRVPPLPGDALSPHLEVVESFSSSRASPPLQRNSSPDERKKPPKSLNLMTSNYISRRNKHSPRRSLPSSPENHDLYIAQNSQRLSLPSSPEIHVERPLPRLTLPPPPDFPAPSLEEESLLVTSAASIDVEVRHDHWQRPEPPTSPSTSLSTRRRPISDNLVERPEKLVSHRLSLSLMSDSPQEESKKETSV